MLCVKVVDVDGFQFLVNNAARLRSMRDLLVVRGSIDRALERDGVEHWQAKRLRGQKNRLNEIINELNDEQAVDLLHLINTCSSWIWESVDGGNLAHAQMRLSRLRGLARQITEAEHFMRLAIDRVERESGGWEGIKVKLEESLANTEAMVEDLRAKQVQKQAEAQKAAMASLTYTRRVNLQRQARRGLKRRECAGAR